MFPRPFRRLRFLGFVLLTLCASPGTGAQSPTSPLRGAIVVGRVIDVRTGAPIEGARVTRWLTSSTPQYEVLTDRQGRFLYRDVAPGAWHLVAEIGGYVTGSYGQTLQQGPSLLLVVTEGALKTDVVLRMWKFGAITGAVVDELGDPAVGVTVHLLKRFKGAQMPERTSISTYYQIGTTDDRGLYRIVVQPDEFLGVAVFPASTTTVPADLANRDAQGGLTSPARPDLAPVTLPASPAITSNDLRFFVTSPTRPGPIPPASTGTSRSRVYLPAFTPGSPWTLTTSIIVGPGEEYRAPDIHLVTTPGVTVTGRAIVQDGPLAGLGVRLMPLLGESDPFTPPLDLFSALTDARGVFTFLGVPAGRYKVVVADARPLVTTPTAARLDGNGSVSIVTPAATTPAAADAHRFWGSGSIVVGDRDLSGVELQVYRGVHVSGQMVIPGGAPAPATVLQRSSVTLYPVSYLSSLTTTRPSPTAQFLSNEVPGDLYLMTVNLPAGWMLKSAMYRGQDLADTLIQIDREAIADVVVTVTDKLTTLSGTVQKTASAADDSALVVTMPANFRSRPAAGMNPKRLQSARTTTNGGYTINGLPPGDYLVAAIDAASALQWPSRQMFEKVAAFATPMTITEGTTAQADLRTRSVK